MSRSNGKNTASIFNKMDDNLTYMITTVSKQIENELPDLLAGTDLNATGYRILTCVSTYDAVSISDLGRIMQIDRAQISRAAVTLEKQGYVVFRNHEQNRRKKMVTLSPAGVDMLGVVAPRVGERRKRLEDALGKERLAETLRALHDLADALPR